ncbi:MAG TPA: protein kinase [Thermoanaerobaculia bacterium]|nr:protein kinase [Thermoanaerobaculia bacterium]
MRRRTWKDELATLVFATFVQLGLVWFMDWSRENAATQEMAARLVRYRFFFAPQILTVVLVYLVARLVRSILDLRGMRFRDWLRSSAVLVGFGAAFIPAAHLDQIFNVLSAGFGLSFLEPAAESLLTAPFYQALQRTSMLRFAMDLAGLLIFLVALRFARPVPADIQAARDAARFAEWIRAGELYLKGGDLKKAKQMFRRGKAWPRLAMLAQRDGNPREAAALYQRAGDAYAWEASRALDAAGDVERARGLMESALSASRAASRWDRVAEIAETVGDQATLAEACRKLAESEPPGPVRAALWKRAADAARAAGRPLEAAEAYRHAQDFTAAGEMYLEGSRPLEAIREFERSGALDRAAMAAAAAGDERASHELAAREAEGRGDLPAAAEAWRKAGQVMRAAALFERVGELARAADAWKESGRLERAAPLWEKAGDLANAAATWEAAGQLEKAATLFAELKQFEKAAELYRQAGKLPLSASALQAAGRFDEAAAVFVRVGRRLEAARSYLLGGRRDRAWEELVGVPRNDAGVAGLFDDLARAHLDAGEAKDAVHVMREAVGKSPVTVENLPLYKTYLLALKAAGDPTEAIEIGRVAAVDPSVLDGSPVVAQRVPSGERDLPGMPAALVRTPPMVARSGQRRIPQSTSSSTIPAYSAQPSPAPAPAQVNVNASGTYTAPEAPEQRYRILAELGRGGMGVVHKALDLKLDRYVALKILPWQLRGDETAMRYFTREAKSIAALKHPNVVALYDYGEGFGSLYLAMEYLEGPNLQKLLKTEPNRVRRNWRDWFVQAARGIAAAHAKGILHRDLKPANLQLDEHDILRILDFGLALPQADAGGTSKLIGSPAFFPPEVLRGEMPSPASDVYSLGAAFYTLATGRWPYVGDDVLVARLERDPDDPRPYAAFLSEPEIAVIMKSLARHRPDRYPDGGELLGDLLAIEG